MLMIRLQRMGKTKRPSYRLIVSPKHKDTQSGQLEILGNYDPVQKTTVVNLKKDRLEYWLSVGAQPSPTVHNILVAAGVIQGEKQKSVFFTKKRTAKIEKTKTDKVAAEQAAKEAKAKAEADAKAKAEAEAQAAAEAKAAAEAAPVVEEAPVAETAPEAPTEEPAA